MRAIQIKSPGGPEVLQIQDVPKPSPSAGEALVRLAAVGINFMDIYLRRSGRGSEAFIPGGEGAGIVEEVGPGVTDVKPGDRVAYAGVTSSYAEYVVCPVDKLISLPDWISFEEAAAFPLQGMTAQYLLTEFAHVGAGTVVLVHAVAGGVGLLLTQMAAHLNANVIGTTSSAEKAAIARDAGANDVILYNEQDFVQEVMRITNDMGADLILDGVGKTTMPGDLQAVRIRGTVVIYGAASGPAEPIVPNALMGRSIKLAGGSLPNYTTSREEIEGRAVYVLNGMREGWLKLRIDRVLPLEKAEEAHRLLESRQTSGKLLLSVG